MDPSHISQLAQAELLGWHAVISHPLEPWGRAPQPGELAEVLARAMRLGIVLSASTSRAALFRGEENEQSNTRP